VVAVVDKAAAAKKEYALKALKREGPGPAYDRFVREIEVVKQIDHPSIIKIVDHSVAGADFPYYVMELIPNAVSLKSLLGSDKNPYRGDPLRASCLFIAIMDVIVTCEKQAVVHRDLSPANILILPDKSIRIIDFGLCQIEDGTTITLTDEGVGTPNYMAPECEAGGANGPITSQADLYSAGKVLWSAITNRFAFARESPVFGSLSMESLFPRQPALWHLQAVFAKTIRRNPADRWKKANDALEHAQGVCALIVRGYPPLERLKTHCPVCGLGLLRRLDAVVFNNPPDPGFDKLICDYCGFCFARNRATIEQSLKSRKPSE